MGLVLRQSSPVVYLITVTPRFDVVPGRAVQHTGVVSPVAKPGQRVKGKSLAQPKNPLLVGTNEKHGQYIWDLINISVGAEPL